MATQDKSSADWQFIVRKTMQLPDDAVRQLHGWDHTAFGSLSLWELPEGFRLRFEGMASFDLNFDRRAVLANTLPSTNSETTRHLLLDQVLPRLLAHEGHLVLHAGAIACPGRVVAFIGESGAGKSTLTASFHADGHPLLSDDGVVVAFDNDTITVSPTYQSLRLWPESIQGVFPGEVTVAPMAHYSAKLRIMSEQMQATDAQVGPLGGICLLSPQGTDGDPTIYLESLSPREAYFALLRNTFQLNTTARRQAVGMLAKVSRIAECVPVYRLIYPHRFEALPAVRETILTRL